MPVSTVWKLAQPFLVTPQVQQPITPQDSFCLSLSCPVTNQVHIGWSIVMMAHVELQQFKLEAHNAVVEVNKIFLPSRRETCSTQSKAQGLFPKKLFPTAATLFALS
jgi:hypothetical protein